MLRTIVVAYTALALCARGANAEPSRGEYTLKATKDTVHW